MTLHPDIKAVLDGESEGCIVCGDCLEVMADMPDGCVNAVVTDPPWRATKGTRTLRRPGDGRGVAPSHLVTSLSYGDVGEFLPEAISEGGRLASQDTLVLCGYMELQEVLARTSKLRGVYVWHNTRPTPIPGPVAFRNVSFIVWGGANTNVKKGRSWQSCLFVYPSLQGGCMATERILGRDGSSVHPCQEPLGLFVEMVEPLGGIILDPFCGSGTTCVAAKKLGRRWIGIDISEKYCQISRNRVRNTERPLFKD